MNRSPSSPHAGSLTYHVWFGVSQCCTKEAGNVFWGVLRMGWAFPHGDVGIWAGIPVLRPCCCSSLPGDP